LVGLVFYFGVNNLFIKRRGGLVGTAVWEDRGATPLGDKGYTPQGMTWVNGKIIFANTWKNTRSRVYEIDPSSMEIKRFFDMPEEAVHTSGFGWDGKLLWGVDYISNRAYCINLKESLAKGEISLVGSFDTTLKGTSACCIIPWEGKEYLAISDFMNTRRTIFVEMEKALKDGTAEKHIVFDYRNEGFSQGLEYIDGFLYESENKLGFDIVNKMDLKKLKQTRDARKSTILQYPAPNKGVEDLAWDGKFVWTSDEAVFRFFKGTLSP
jgi:glutamine cyclotransferase